MGRMRRCVVSMKGKDNQLHSLETDATSLFAAVYEGVCCRSRLWWYSGDAVIEVQAGEQC
jgi:hypothetical protein